MTPPTPTYYAGIGSRSMPDSASTRATVPVPDVIERGGWSAEQNHPLLHAETIIVYTTMATIDLEPSGPEDLATNRLRRLNRARTFHPYGAAKVKPYRVRRVDTGEWVQAGSLVFVHYEREEQQAAPLTRAKVEGFIRRCIRISGDTHHVFFEGLHLREVRGGIPVYEIYLGS